MEWDWEKFYDRVHTWLITQLPKVLMAIAVLLVGLWVIRHFNKWLKKGLERKKFNPSLRYFFLNLVAISLQVVLVLVVLQIAGFQLTFLTAIIAGLSVAAGLALSGTLQNFVSGILILFLRPYNVGDFVVMQGQEGKVISIQLFHTLILTADNKTIIVPNGQLSNNVVINLSKEGRRRLDISLKFSYAVSRDQVKNAIKESVAETDNVLHEPVAEVVVSALEADKYTVDVQVWVNVREYEKARFVLQEKIMDRLVTAGIYAAAK